MGIFNIFIYFPEFYYYSFFFFSNFLQVYHEVKDGNVLTVNHVKKVLRNEYPYADVQSILGVHSEYDEGRKVS